MTDNAFGSTTETTQEVTPTPPSLDSLLAGILNENGEQKYKTLEDAIRALDASQKYIPELKNQLSGYQSKVQELEAKVNQFDNIEGTVQRLLAQNTEVTPTQSEPTAVDEQAVLKTVQNVLAQREAAERADANFKLVYSKLKETYGDKSGEVAEAKAREHGMTTDALAELAKSNPTVALSLFQTAVHTDPARTSGGRVTPPPVKVNVQAEKPAGKSLIVGISDRERGAYFNDLRKEVYGKLGYDVA